MQVNDRKSPPNRKTDLGGNAPFRIWILAKAYDEDQHPWKMAAAFYFLLDALDYIAKLQDDGCDCVYQNPTDCRTVKSTDRRMVAA